MAESFITQCPHCGTSFRVRTEQLSVANGSVRCGACLQVFSARNHIVNGTTQPAKAPPKPAAAAKPSAPARPAQSALNQTPKKPQPQASRPASPPPRPAAPAPAYKKPEPETEQFLADEDEKAEFLFDDEEEFIFSDDADSGLFDDEEEEQDDGLGEFSDSFLNLDKSAPAAPKGNPFQQETLIEEDEDDEDDVDESWAESMLEEIEKEDKSTAKKAAVFHSKDPTPTSRNKPAPERQVKARSKTPMQPKSPVQPKRPAQPKAPKPKPEAEEIPLQTSSILDFDDEDFTIPPSASQVVNQAARTDFDLDFQHESRLSRLRPLGWLLIIALLVTLTGQLAWMQRDTFARMDQWRGIYVKACDVFKCTLPEQIDLEKIRTSILVRDHKDRTLTDIKIVDIILTNQAAFKQAFPALVLQYTDVNGKLVADQTYQPSTYLKGEMTGVELMPINTRIYIALPIKKPGANAVNYQLLLTPEAKP